MTLMNAYINTPTTNKINPSQKNTFDAILRSLPEQIMIEMIRDKRATQRIPTRSINILCA